MSKAANKKILSLVKSEYMKRIPFFVRAHATTKSCEHIAQQHPDLYAAFEGEPSATQIEEMSNIINTLFEERMKKHNL